MFLFSIEWLLTFFRV